MNTQEKIKKCMRNRFIFINEDKHAIVVEKVDSTNGIALELVINMYNSKALHNDKLLYDEQDIKHFEAFKVENQK
ncbi:MAG: hypothetical protein HRU03_06815 [Nanoarchaeales archaeon]|nr:hypothetical protein [Nanoarchaeales archaeon]